MPRGGPLRASLGHHRIWAGGPGVGSNGEGCVPPVCPRAPPRVSQRRYPAVGWGGPAGSAAASSLNKGAIASLLITPPGWGGGRGGAGQLSPGPCGLGGRGGAMLMKGGVSSPPRLHRAGGHWLKGKRGRGRGDAMQMRRGRVSPRPRPPGAGAAGLVSGGGASQSGSHRERRRVRAGAAGEGGRGRGQREPQGLPPAVCPSVRPSVPPRVRPSRSLPGVRPAPPSRFLRC